MSFNIVDLVKDHLTDQVMETVGGMIGGNTAQTGSALSGALPGLLNSFMNSGSSSSGAGALFDAVNNQDDSILDTLTDALSGSGQNSLASSGSSLLGSLLGNSGTGGLANAVSSLSGLGKGSSSTLLGMLAPIVLGVIKRKLIGGGGLNVSSLMDMFTGQKQNIQAAIPSGFLDSINSSTQEARHTTAHTETTAHTVDTRRSDEGSSFLKKWLPLLIFLAGLFILYNLFFNKSTETESIEQRATTLEAQQPATESTPDMSQNNPSMVNDIRNSLGTIASGLNNIKDVDSAKQALPAITGATEKMGELGGMMESLPAPAKDGVMRLVSSAIPQLQAMADKATALPGVGEVIKPTLDTLFEKLKLFQ